MTAIEETRPRDRPPDAVVPEIDYLVSVISECAAALAEEVRTVADRLPAWSTAVILDEVTEIEDAVEVIGRLSHQLAPGG
jgi:hypothetical protein